jgi:hypothetical protein
MNPHMRANGDFASTKPRGISLPSGLNQDAACEIDSREVSAPVCFEIKLPKGARYCSLFDGSLVETIYMSPQPVRRERRLARLKAMSARSGR